MRLRLHSRKTAIKIVDHFEKEVFTKIIQQNLKVCFRQWVFNYFKSLSYDILCER